VAAVFEKEIRYLLRSGPMLFTLIMPVFMLLIFRLGPASAARGGSFLMRAPNLAFPSGAAYSLLILTNLVYNNFGGDSGGIQFFFAAPVRFQQVVVGKNLAHMTVLVLIVTLVWVGVNFIYAPPALDVTFATLAGILFAAPVNLAAGNLLSVYSPKRVDFAKFGRQRASQMTVLASLGIQFAVVGLGASTLLLSRRYGSYWLGGVIFVVLAALALAGYALSLNLVDRMALKRQETLIGELCRA
jgi:ABC-2 type transport system permease protein